MIQTHDIDQFARRCLDHLHGESAMMREVIESLSTVRQSLLNSPGERLAAAVDNQQVLCQRVQEIRQVRVEIRKQLARVLGIPECDATIGKLAENVSSDVRRPLLDARQNLSQLTREAEVLLRGNTALIRHNAEILQQLAECITGQTALPERYGASGKKSNRSTSPLFELGTKMFHGLSIGLSGIQASQVGLDVVAQNISNANTPGYHRQVVHLVDRDPLERNGLSIGTGVDVAGIGRMRDSILERAVVRNVSSSAENDVVLSVFERIESLLVPGTGSINERVNGFFSDLEALSARPHDPVARQITVNGGVQLAETLNRLTSELDRLQNELDGQITDTVDRINTLTGRIAELNDKIVRLENRDIEPNDLLDQRDALVEELAQLIDVELDEVEDSVTLARGPSVFSNQPPPQLAVQSEGDVTTIIRYDLHKQVIPHGGSLAGLLLARNEVLTSYEEKLDAIARTIIGAIDPQHAKGVGLNGGFESLTSRRPAARLDIPVAELETVVPITDGQLFVAVTDSSGTRTIHEITIDAQTDSILDIATSIDSIDHLQAFTDSTTGKLSVVADSGYTFDFTDIMRAVPDASSLTGSSAPSIAGTYTGAGNDAYVFQFNGTGNVGVTADLSVEVRDNAGTVVAEVAIGAGYEPGTELDIGNGLTVSFSSGDVTNGESFSSPIIADSDTSGLLAALGLNTFFVGNSARTIGVNPDLVKSPDSLATTRTGLAGDSSNLTAMIERRHSLSSPDGTRNVEGIVADTIATVGVHVQTRTETGDQIGLILHNVQTQRAASSGVDPNEELVLLLQFQRSFQLAAKYVSVIGDVTAELVQIIR